MSTFYQEAIIHMTVNTLGYAETLFAILAAGFWLWSALVKLPKSISHIDYGYISDAPKPVDDMDLLTIGLKKQSRLSALAATCAAAAAFSHAILIWVQK